jgi:hypothetical protein
VATRSSRFERSSLLHSHPMVSDPLSHLRRIGCRVTRSSFRSRSAPLGSALLRSLVSKNPASSGPLAPLSVNSILFDRALVSADVSTRDLQLNRKVEGVARSGELTSLSYTQLSR